VATNANRSSLVSLFVRSAIFWVVVPGSVFVLVPLMIRRGSDVSWTAAAGLSTAIGVVLLVVGVGVMLLCAVDFVLQGWGTAAPYDPPKRLVTGRLYTRVRNQMYVAGVLLLVAEALVFRSPPLFVWAVVMVLLWHLAVVPVEEPGLRRRFGPDYEACARRVPRWVPRSRDKGPGPSPA
jgi:protein-S-isoprenylcysteine O-methyltransferase Ste14